jgi:5-methylcytosine-specific restriction endonuclease McrA
MYKHQKGLCWICGEHMAISDSRAGSENFATFDHLLPKAQGGTRAQTNLKLAHQKCNNLRGDLPIVGVMIATGQL